MALSSVQTFCPGQCRRLSRAVGLGEADGGGPVKALLPPSRQVKKGRASCSRIIHRILCISSPPRSLAFLVWLPVALSEMVAVEPGWVLIPGDTRRRQPPALADPEPGISEEPKVEGNEAAGRCSARLRGGAG